MEQIEHNKNDQASVDTKLPDGELLEPEVRVRAERRLVRTLDMRLLPTIIVIFIMNYIDVSSSSLTVVARSSVLNISKFSTGELSQRVAVTSARLKGLTQDLGLTGGVLWCLCFWFAKR